MAHCDGLDVSVVLPTYNESKSLPGLIPRIVRALTDAGLRGEVIVVDDNSPDDTAAVAEQIAREHPVRVLKRITERGLGTAVTAGFQLSQATVCVVMDADGSHPVEALGGMVRMILEDKAELVVGSRHVQGGGSKDWPLFSQLKSRFAASLAVGLTSMTDPTTGFMAVRRSLLARLTLDPVGWKIVLETVVKAHPARLAEVPIVFTDREHGESKQSFKVLLQYLGHLYKLYQFRFPGFIEFLKFCLVGVLGVFVDLSVVAALHEMELFSLDLRLCQVFGFSAAVTFNYAINRRFSFARARELPVVSSYVTYVGANLLGLTARMLVIQTLLTLTTLESATGYGYLLLSAIGIALSTLINFVGVKYLAFAPAQTHRDSSESVPIVVSTARPHSSRLLTNSSVLLALGLCAAGAVWKQTSHPDEAVNLIMAENIRGGFEGLVHPSITPGFAGDWATEALPALGNTPVYPALLALFAPAGHGLWLVLGTFALTLLSLWLTLSRTGNGSAGAAVLLLASAPWIVQPFTLFEFEPLVTCLGALGFALVARAGAGARGRALAVSGGLFLGLGFATKMWLIVPAWLACVAFFAARAYDRSGPRQRTPGLGLLVIAGVTLGALSHLIFVAITAPADLPLWVERVYLAIFSGAGVTGEKLSASAEPAASVWAYARWLLRDHGALLAPIILGLPALTRRLDGQRRAWLAAGLGALSALVPLSVPIYKEPLYMLPALPFVYMLAGMCLVAPDLAPARNLRINQGAARVSIACALLLCGGWLATSILGGGHEPRMMSVALHMGHVLVWTWPSVSLLRTGASARAIAPAAILSLALTGLALRLDL